MLDFNELSAKGVRGRVRRNSHMVSKKKPYAVPLEKHWLGVRSAGLD